MQFNLVFLCTEGRDQTGYKLRDVGFSVFRELFSHQSNISISKTSKVIKGHNAIFLSFSCIFFLHFCLQAGGLSAQQKNRAGCQPHIWTPRMQPETIWILALSELEKVSAGKTQPAQCCCPLRHIQTCVQLLCRVVAVIKLKC